MAPGRDATADGEERRGPRLAGEPGGGDLIRVLLVDDQALVRAGLARIFGFEPEIDVVGECCDGEEAVAACAEHEPDVVLMDIRMPHLDGIAATRAIKARPPAPGVLVLTTYDDDHSLMAALEAGADGFILKDASGPDLVRATMAVGAGKAWLDVDVTARVIAAFRRDGVPRLVARARRDDLTAREVEVLRLIACGASNTEIAAELHISEPTVKSHVRNILSKLCLRDRPAAIIYAIQYGIADVPT